MLAIFLSCYYSKFVQNNSKANTRVTAVTVVCSAGIQSYYNLESNCRIELHKYLNI